MIDLITPAPHARLFVLRDTFTDSTSIGTFRIDGAAFCDTLEPTVRAGADGILTPLEKIQGKTAIPTGVYELDLLMSDRFGFCPFVQNVPLFENIRVHWGNFAVSTEGCTLVGKRSKTPDEVLESKDTFRLLMMELVPMRKAEKIWIAYEGGPSVEQLKLIHSPPQKII